MESIITTLFSLITLLGDFVVNGLSYILQGFTFLFNIILFIPVQILSLLGFAPDFVNIGLKGMLCLLVAILALKIFAYLH